jgi:hypothetical protein
MRTMGHRSRPLSVLSLVLLLALSGCCIGNWGSDKVESAVADVPVTLKDVKKRHQPPERTATVETVTESTGGGGFCAEATPVPLERSALRWWG